MLMFRFQISYPSPRKKCPAIYNDEGSGSVKLRGTRVIHGTMRSLVHETGLGILRFVDTRIVRQSIKLVLKARRVLGKRSELLGVGVENVHLRPVFDLVRVGVVIRNARVLRNRILELGASAEALVKCVTLQE